MTTQHRERGGDGGYFGRHYGDVRFPIAQEEEPGLRRGQLGALHAVAAHFSLKKDAAVVTMPTGSGKTVVIALSAFLLRARRVLVITPSRLVRSQIADEFATLGRVRATGSLPDTIELPAVFEVEHRLNDPAAWKALAPFDVVVGTPNCVSPAVESVSAPPPDFFDLILVDEAHHSPARTWAEVLASFPAARRLLVTATPFRRDRKEIKGTFIFEYPVRQAFEDGVFGRIEFHPLDDHGQEQNDLAIATAAEALLRTDRAAGLRHFLMVRTDSRARAEELEDLYATQTTLNLRRIDSSYSLRYVRSTIAALRRQELDGIIAVDMLGEGFDFPNLKIAAVHSPHKSLAATLQFVGRFARTGAESLGQAKFVAITQEIRGGLEELYDEGAAWHEIVPMLTDSRVQDEVSTRLALAELHSDERYTVDEETRDLSLYGVRPYSHVKIYAVGAGIDVSQDIEMTGHLEVIHREVSEDASTVIFLTKEEVQPKWAPPGRFRNVEYDLFIVYHDRATGLVFICTSRRSESIYRHLIRQLAGDHHEILSVDVVNRVLGGIDSPEAFNVGMRNRLQASAESYRIMAGSNPAQRIKRSDGRMYHRGHAMFRGQEAGAKVTVGFSSSSKVWSNGYVQIPELLAWCRRLAAKLQRELPRTTTTNWDLLPTAQRITKLPAAPAIAVNWDKDVYLEPPLMRVGVDGSQKEVSVLDCDIVVDEVQPEDAIAFSVQYADRRWPLRFTLDPKATVEALGWREEDGPTIEWEGETLGLPSFMSITFPTFYFPDFSTLTGRDFVPGVTDGLAFDPTRIEVIDWNAASVDIQAERRAAANGRITIHAYLRERFLSESHAAVVYDDGSGEVADFVVIDENDSEVRVSFYHAKGSRGEKAGRRVSDVFEVCGQAVKSLSWAKAHARLLERLIARSSSHEAERLVTGTIQSLKVLREAVGRKKVSYHMVIVQPGISRAGLKQSTVALPLAATEEFVMGAFESLLVWGSA